MSDKVWFRNGWTCNCVATSLPWVEYDMIRRGLIKQSIDIFQLGYNGGGVQASAGTHDAGGCTDVGQYSDEQIRIWRYWGWTMQARTRAQGFDPHAHGWPIGCSHLSAGAVHQWNQWKNRTNGLASYGPITGPYTTDTWRKALERNFYQMFTITDIKKAMGEVIDARLDDIAKRVLSQDGVIPNVFTPNQENKFVSLATALKETNSANVRLNEQIGSLKREVATLKNTLGGK